MSLTIQAKHPLFVAEVSNVDLSVSVDDAILGEIKEGLNERAVLLFRGPKLTQAQQIAFAERFGPLESSNNVLSSSSRDRISSQLADVSNLSASNEPLEQSDRRRMFGLGNQLWHTDSSFKRVPAKGSILAARIVPSAGGETEYADMRAAYDALAPGMQAFLRGKTAVHNYAYSQGLVGGMGALSQDEWDAVPPVEHPLIRTHPATGRRSLYLGRHASHISGEDVEESRGLLRRLCEQACRPPRVYKHRWRAGDMVMWDNRCVLHRGHDYPSDQPRHMVRTTIAGASDANEWRLPA